MTRKFLPKLLLLIGACLSMSVQQAIAELPYSNVDRLMASNKWSDAARAIFLESRTFNVHESTVIIGQAKGGFLTDALESIYQTHFNSRANYFLYLAQLASGIASEKRKELVQKSLEAARNQAGNYLKSDPLINIALYFSGNGADSEARAVFSEAMAAAEKGLAENGSGGYGQITQAMKVASPDSVKDWMLPILNEKLAKPSEAISRAFACIDMVSVAGRLGQFEQASQFVECAKSAIGRISDRSRKKMADERLADAALSIGLNYAGASVSRYSEAILAARSGNIQKSYDIVLGFTSNLYVDHQLSAYTEVLDDALRRNDLKAAHFFAERSIGKGLLLEVKVWQKIAEKEAELGEKASAGKSYARAVSVLDSGNSSRYIADVLIFLRLGESMLRNGLSEEGRRVILLTLPLFEGYADKRRADDLVEASAAVAESLWAIGMRDDAKKFLREAYLLASTYDAGRLSYGASKKARLLAIVGSTAVIFSTSNSLKKGRKQKM